MAYGHREHMDNQNTMLSLQEQRALFYYSYFKGRLRKLTTSRCCSPLMSTASKLTTEHAKDGNVISSFTKDNSQRIIKLSIDQKINPVCWLDPRIVSLITSQTLNYKTLKSLELWTGFGRILMSVPQHKKPHQSFETGVRFLLAFWKQIWNWRQKIKVPGRNTYIDCKSLSSGSVY